VREFIDQRQYDQIGLIAFAKQSYTVAPMTVDYEWLQKNLDRVQLYMIEDGTAVGSAIMASVKRLEESQAKSRIVILLTDGYNNEGQFDPLQAARVAEAKGIKFYTIGAGTSGEVPIPRYDQYGRKVYRNYIVKIDERTLKEVANITGGQYYRATDTQSLRQIYKDIDALEKTEIEQIGYFQYEELFKYFVLAGLVFLALELLCRQWWLMRLPA
jgi:Ca-activated chloride channel family protein